MVPSFIRGNKNEKEYINNLEAALRKIKEHLSFEVEPSFRLLHDQLSCMYEVEIIHKNNLKLCNDALKACKDELRYWKVGLFFILSK